ncbi:MAG: hypothetical protein HY731_12825 [Candidatus Tectomicrobia bacterium]|nr:hypothetical protein [Candidatus Tectomicrobia bacterium]
MRLLKNPLVIEGIELYFQDSKRLSAYIVYLLSTATILFVVWPTSQSLKIGEPPDTYNFVLIGTFIFIAYLSCTAGSRDLSQHRFHLPSQWIFSTPISIRAFLSGKLFIAFIHTLFLLFLALPLIVIPRVISGIALKEMGLGLLLTLVCCFTYRIIGLCNLILMERNQPLLYIAERGAFLLFILITSSFFPLGNPVLAIISLVAEEEKYRGVVFFQTLIPFFWMTMIIHLLIAFTFVIVMAQILIYFRKSRIHPEAVSLS